MRESKTEFLKKYGDHYGYNGLIDALREDEFKRLEGCWFFATAAHLLGTVYLDHAAATLHAQSQMRDATDELSQTVLGNPHSASRTSDRAASSISAARESVLHFFNASSKKYSVIFTAGATAALRLIGELFPWTSESRFEFLRPSHTSVVGIRECVLQHSGSFRSVPEEEAFAEFISSDSTAQDNLSSEGPFHLFAFPAECNFSGRKFPMSWADAVHKRTDGRWLSVVDAAKAAGSGPLDIGASNADFVVISFYKMFGWPDGLGALILKNGS